VNTSAQTFLAARAAERCFYHDFARLFVARNPRPGSVDRHIRVTRKYDVSLSRLGWREIWLWCASLRAGRIHERSMSRRTRRDGEIVVGGIIAKRAAILRMARREPGCLRDSRSNGTRRLSGDAE
jgi:hypothetical protein